MKRLKILSIISIIFTIFFLVLNILIKIQSQNYILGLKSETEKYGDCYQAYFKDEIYPTMTDFENNNNTLREFSQRDKEIYYVKLAHALVALFSDSKDIFGRMPYLYDASAEVEYILRYPRQQERELNRYSYDETKSSDAFKDFEAQLNDQNQTSNKDYKKYIDLINKIKDIYGN